jgi:crossover junction endodeoxyribonuclease RuvC
MRVLGVDPGLTGAIALWDTAIDGLLLRDMPVGSTAKATRREVVPEWLAQLIREYEPDLAWLEQVSAMPKQGVSSVFSFGCSYGMARGVLAALAIPTHLVTPAVWKRALGLGSDKSHSRALAARVFARHAGEFARVRDDGRAEAALLTHYGLSQLPAQAVVSRCPVSFVGVGFPLDT